MKDGQYLIEMGSKIKARRLELKLSLPQLSKLCNTDMSNLWFIEKGQRNLHILTLKRIAEELKLNIADLI